MSKRDATAVPPRKRTEREPLARRRGLFTEERERALDALVLSVDALSREIASARGTPSAVVLEPSGVQWCSRYPTSRSVDDLIQPFRGNVERFLAALSTAGASVSIAATYRPRERAHLMHWAWRIGRLLEDPRIASRDPGIPIDWVHRDALGAPDLVASKRAAQEMVAAYDMAQIAALNSRHIERLAIDMSIRWKTQLSVLDAAGNIRTIPGPGNGEVPALHQVGRSYGVVKLVSDPPHWSIDGR